jgi:tRNA A-37 threonylcarbamoyl transferase component Bud32
VAACGAPERAARLRARIDQVAGLVRGLHERHLCHRDFKAANLLIVGDRMWLIDLVGVRRCRWLIRARRVQNLARLHASFHADPAVTRTDKVRFLRAYQQWGLRGKGGWKKWWRAVERATQAKVARNRRRGRPLG